MSTLVVGDLHLKQRLVLPRVDELLAGDFGIDRVVFLGDACDDWGATERHALDAMGFYADWVEARRADGLQVDVLMGNHDFCYIRGKSGPGSLMGIHRELRTILEERLRVRVAAAVGPCLCTHAGLTGVWADRVLGAMSGVGFASMSAADAARAFVEPGFEPGFEAAAAPAAESDCAFVEPGSGPDAASSGEAIAASLAAPSGEAIAASLADQLNEMLLDGARWADLDSCPPSRGGWSLPGPLWADLSDLQSDPYDGITQLVGHTPVATAAQVNASRGRASFAVGTSSSGAGATDAAPLSAAGVPAGASAQIWACDTFSLTSFGFPVGDGSMLLVDRGAIRPVPFGERVTAYADLVASASL